MAITGAFMSWMSDLIAYRRTRLPWAVFVPLAICLRLVTGAIGDSLAWASCAFAWLLLVQFRLLDDLMDRHRDAADHPERVLVRASYVRPFGLLLLLLTALNGFLAGLSSPQFLLMYCVLTALQSAWYILRQNFAIPEGLHVHVLLTKYPMFVYLVHPSHQASPSWLVLGGVYLALCVYEGLHDRRRRADPTARLILALESAALCGLLVISLFGFWEVDT
jgi:4-hydroxybenzoate polyprenyltransferase